MSELIISVSGLRGIIGKSLTPEVAVRYAAAFASELPLGPIVVTRDGRTTGAMLVDAIKSSLAAMGRSVIDAGIAATPTTGVLVRQLHAVGGMQISASHNPPEYNGLKLFSNIGRVVDAAAGEKVRQRYLAGAFAWAEHQAIGGTLPLERTFEEHLQLVLKTVDVERIRAKSFRVLLDSNHGAGSILGRHLLTALGCELVLMGETPDGLFAHPAEPIAENLAGISQQVREAKVDVGFCQDPDADRLAVIDAQGNYLGEEYTLALCFDHVLRASPGPIVTNCATSRMSQDLAKKYGVPYIASAVGEANVVDAMLAHKAVFGGEGNGGPIDPRVGYVRDSFVGMALLLDAMASTEKSIRELADSLPRYEIFKTKVVVAREKISTAIVALQQEFAEAKANLQDGLRLDWDDRWLLVRASNTEPIVRLIAEATSLEEAKALCGKAAEVIASLS